MMLDEIRAAFDSGIWYPAIASALMLPDACGAVEYWGSGRHSRDRYAEWYDGWVYPHYNPRTVTFDGAVIYIVRNAMIHESTGFTRGKHGFDRVLFSLPRADGLQSDWNLSGHHHGSTEMIFQVSLEKFLNAMEQGVRSWLTEVRADDDKRRQEAIDKLIQFRPDGHYPHIVGIPIIS